MTGAQAILTQISGYSYLGVYGISLVANVLFIIPEEVVLLSLGYAAHAGNFNIFLMIPIVIAGLLSSDFLVYTLSRSGSKFLDAFYKRFFSKRFEFLSKRFSDNDNWVETHIEKIIFYSRFLMQLRFLGPFMAGQLKVSKRKYLVYELAALVVYVPLLLWIGWYFHAKVSLIIGKVRVVRNTILLAIGVALAFALLRFVYNWINKKVLNRNDEK